MPRAWFIDESLGLMGSGLYQFTDDFSTDKSEWISPPGANWSRSGGKGVCVPAYIGGELCGNVDFASDNGWWTKNTWTIPGDGYAHIAGVAGNLDRASLLTLKHWYYTVYDVATWTSGQIRNYIGTDKVGFAYTNAGAGRAYSQIARQTTFRITAAGTTPTGTITNVHLYELDVPTCMRFVRMASPRVDVSVDLTLATYIAGGLVVLGDNPYNLQNYAHIYRDRTDLVIEQVLAGAVSNELLRAAISFANGRTLRVAYVGSGNWNIFYNGAQIGGNIQFDPSLAGNPFVGTFLTGAGASLAAVDNFSCTVASPL